jgi:hypothetical protein
MQWHCFVTLDMTVLSCICMQGQVWWHGRWFTAPGFPEGPFSAASDDKAFAGATWPLKAFQARAERCSYAAARKAGLAAGRADAVADAANDTDVICLDDTSEDLVGPSALETPSVTKNQSGAVVTSDSDAEAAPSSAGAAGAADEDTSGARLTPLAQVTQSIGVWLS